MAGLEFGPAYRQLARAKRTDTGVIEVELTPQAGDSRFGLDPARLNSCFHGLILLFADRESGSGAYLPVRFDDVRLIEPGEGITRACIRVKRQDARVIIADFDLFDGEGRLAATFVGRASRRSAVRAGAGLEQLGIVRVWIPMPRGRAAPRSALA